MIINSSSVAMKASRAYTSFSYKESVSVDTRKEDAAALNISPTSEENYATQLKQKIKEQNEAYSEKRKENEQKNLQNMLQTMNSSAATYENSFDVQADDGTIALLKKILAFLRGDKDVENIDVDIDKLRAQMRRCNHKSSTEISSGCSVSVMNLSSVSSGEIKAGTERPLNVWTKTEAVSTYFGEVESTSFQSTGVAFTADGRKIDFNVEIGMSRAFQDTFDSFTQTDYICTDPLMINVEAGVTEISDKKFFFDLDCDGKEEKISYAAGGSGFLALDKNGDGKINDGSELFGTKSGDGFADLAKYDEDGNGWIDEADDIFKHLKIWKKNDDGADQLISLKDFGVGAIYLSSAKTQFSLTDDDNNTNGIIRKTGIYLKENGDVGSLQHVDLVL